MNTPTLELDLYDHSSDDSDSEQHNVTSSDSDSGHSGRAEFGFPLADTVTQYVYQSFDVYFRVVRGPGFLCVEFRISHQFRLRIIALGLLRLVEIVIEPQLYWLINLLTSTVAGM